MFPAARIFDTVTHDGLAPSGTILPPLAPPTAPPVIIEGQPAAFITCTVVCSGATSAGMPAHPPPGVGAPPATIVLGSKSVLINGFPAARWAPSGDMTSCMALLGDFKLFATRKVLIGDDSVPAAGAMTGAGGGGGAGGALKEAAGAAAGAAAAPAAAAATSSAGSAAASAGGAAASSAPSSAAPSAPDAPAPSVPGPPTTPARQLLRENVLNDLAQGPAPAANAPPAAAAAPAAAAGEAVSAPAVAAAAGAAAEAAPAAAAAASSAPATAAAGAVASAAANAAPTAIKALSGPPTTAERMILRQELADAMPKPPDVPTPPDVPPAVAEDVPLPDPPVISGNKELMAKYAELQEIGKKLREDGFTPTPDEETIAALQRGDYDDCRFIVSMQAGKDSHAESVGYTRLSGRSTLWSAPYEAMKAGDLSVPLLCAMTGTDYKPDKKYELFIVDKGADYKVNGSYSLVPTFENMQKFGPKELRAGAPNDPVHDEALLKEAMQPEYEDTYRKEMETFYEWAKPTGYSEYREDDMREFLNHRFPTSGVTDPNELAAINHKADLFAARHLYRTEIGCNRDFTGQGTTKFKSDPATIASIEKDGITMKSPPGKVGVPEVLTIEKNPPTVRELHLRNTLLPITIQNAKPTATA